MAELINWPPSRGPNPHERKIVYEPGQVFREDVPMEQSPIAAAEKAVFDEGEAPNGDFSSEAEEQERQLAPIVGKWRVWFQVDDVVTLNIEQAANILRGRKVEPEEDSSVCADTWFQDKFGTLRTVIDYPLSTAVHLTIEPMIVTRSGGGKPAQQTREMRLGYFLWVVSKEYERIYREHEKYGIWGHAMSDLGFEGLVVREDGTVDLIIGS